MDTIHTFDPLLVKLDSSLRRYFPRPFAFIQDKKL